MNSFYIYFLFLILFLSFGILSFTGRNCSTFQCYVLSIGVWKCQYLCFNILQILILYHILLDSDRQRFNDEIECVKLCWFRYNFLSLSIRVCLSKEILVVSVFFLYAWSIRIFSFVHIKSLFNCITKPVSLRMLHTKMGAI